MVFYNFKGVYQFILGSLVTYYMKKGYNYIKLFNSSTNRSPSS